MNKIVLLSAVLLISNFGFAADLEKGKAAFATRCASCHGIGGQADGPVAKAMPGAVTNLVKGPYKIAKDGAKVKELIQKGGAALGLNAMMPPAPSISTEELDDLTAFVMSLRK